MINCSLGIMAHNEEKIIGKSLEAALNQKLVSGTIIEIFIVASGCTDNTINIVKEKFLPRDPRLKLLIQKERLGKATAINLFLENAKGDILISQNADNIPQKDTFEYLIKPFLDPMIGMTGGHPVPVNKADNFMGYVVNLQWRIHHHLNQKAIKLGELVAFRSCITKIPVDTAVDEISLEFLIKNHGLKLHYVPEAIIITKGPETIKDFMKQRRRIFAGHLKIKKSSGYAASSLNPYMALQLVINEIISDPKHFIWILGGISLEIIGRMLGAYDFYIKKKNPVIWDVSESTKRL